MNEGPVTPNERVTFKVRHEDADLLVVEKRARLVSNPGVGHEHDTLLNGLYARYGERLQNLGAKRDFGLLHRLDRDTSGLLIVALNPAAYDAMRAQFEGRSIGKYYWAITRKAPGDDSGVIRRPIIEVVRRKDRYSSQKIARVSKEGKPALTAYRVLARSELGALIEARPVTGRLHQVRVHLDLIGSPILGDEIYAPRSLHAAAPRLALHAHRLTFEHPATGEAMDVRTGLPSDLKILLKKLSLARPGRGGVGVESGEGAHELGGDAVGDEEAGVGRGPAPA